MTKRDWFIVIFLVFFAVVVDQVTKAWALRNLGPLEFYGPIGLVLHRNPGAILGIFSDLPPLLRVVTLSTGGAFLIFIYAAIQYLLRRRSMMLRSGMSLLLGGIIGNVLDRMLSGSVVDFILIGSPQLASPAFNFADAIQWVGYGMIVFALIKEGTHIWPDSNERKQIWVNPSFQIKYCLILMSVGLGFSLIAGVFSFTFIKVAIEELVIGPSRQIVEAKFLIPFLVTFSIISLAFILGLFVLGRILSHRTAGPIYAFEKFLEDQMQGKDRPLRLRAGDDFHHLEELAEMLRSHLNHCRSLEPSQEGKEALAQSKPKETETETA